METKVPGKRESRKKVAIRKVLKGEMEVLLWCGIEAFWGGAWKVERGKS